MIHFTIVLPWGFHDIPEYSEVKCYTGEFCALVEYLFRLSIRDTNKHFWCHCRGSNWLKLSYNWVKNLTVLSPLVLAGLPLLTLLFIRCRAVHDRFWSTIQLRSESSENWANCEMPRRPTPEETHLEPSFVRLSTTHGQDSQAVLGPVQQSHPYWTKQWPRQWWLWAQIRTGEHGSSKSILWKGIKRCQRSPPEFPGSERHYQPRGTTVDNVRLRLFPFSLLGKVKTWFYTN